MKNIKYYLEHHNANDVQNLFDHCIANPDEKARFLLVATDSESEEDWRISFIDDLGSNGIKNTREKIIEEFTLEEIRNLSKLTEKLEKIKKI